MIKMLIGTEEGLRRYPTHITKGTKYKVSENGGFRTDDGTLLSWTNGSYDNLFKEINFKKLIGGKIL